MNLFPQKKTERKKIGVILLEDGAITQAQLDQALEMQKTSTKPLGEVLIQEGMINEKQLISVLGRQLKIPYLPILKYTHNPEASKWVGKNFCQKYNLVPFDGDERVFYISMANPLDRNPINSLQVLLKKKIFVFIATSEEIHKMIELVYG